MGTQPIKIGRDKRQDAIDAENARRNAGSNQFVEGVNSVMDEGIGTAISQSRNKYGNSNVMIGELVGGSGANFSYKDAPGNSPLEDYKNQSGSIDHQTSSTESPQADPEELETDALDRRMNMIAKAAGNADQNLNANNRGM